MAQDQGTGNGEAAAPAGAPQWLMDLKGRSALMRQRRERPAGLCFGRWLGDFLDQDTPSGLLHAEEKLLFAAANGGACVLQSRAGRLWAEFDGWRKRHSMREAPELHSDAGFAEALTKYIGGAPEAVQEVVHEATMRGRGRDRAARGLGAKGRGARRPSSPPSSMSISNSLRRRPVPPAPLPRRAPATASNGSPARRRATPSRPRFPTPSSCRTTGSRRSCATIRSTCPRKSGRRSRTSLACCAVSSPSLSGI